MKEQRKSIFWTIVGVSVIMIPATLLVIWSLVAATGYFQDDSLVVASGGQPPAETETETEAIAITDLTDEALAAINAGGCGACHVIPNVPGAVGVIGPALTEIGADAASRIDGVSAVDYIHQSIVDPAAFIAPECPIGDCVAGVMPPNFTDILDEAQINAIVGYLAGLGIRE